MAPLFGKNHVKLLDEDEERAESSFPRFSSRLNPNNRFRMESKLASEDCMRSLAGSFVSNVDGNDEEDSRATLSNPMKVPTCNATGQASQGSPLAMAQFDFQGEGSNPNSRFDSSFPPVSTKELVSNSSQNLQQEREVESRSWGNFLETNASQGSSLLENVQVEDEEIEGSERYQGRMTMTTYVEEADDLISLESSRSRPQLHCATPSSDLLRFDFHFEDVVSPDHSKHMSSIEGLECSRSRRSLPASLTRSSSLMDGVPCPAPRSSLRGSGQKGLTLSLRDSIQSPSSRRSTNGSKVHEANVETRKMSRSLRSDSRSVSTRESRQSMDNERRRPTGIEYTIFSPGHSGRSSRTKVVVAEQERTSDATKHEEHRRESEGRSRSCHTTKEKVEPMRIKVAPIVVKKTKIRQVALTGDSSITEEKETTAHLSQTTGGSKKKMAKEPRTPRPTRENRGSNSSNRTRSMGKSVCEDKDFLSRTPLAPGISDSCANPVKANKSSSIELNPVVSPDVTDSFAGSKILIPVCRQTKKLQSKAVDYTKVQTMPLQFSGESYRKDPYMDTSDHASSTKANNWNWDDDLWTATPENSPDVIEEEDDENVFGSPTVHSRKIVGCNQSDLDNFFCSDENKKNSLSSISKGRSTCSAPLHRPSAKDGTLRISATRRAPRTATEKTVTMTPKSKSTRESRTVGN